VFSAKLNCAIGWMPAGGCSWARFDAPRVARLTISDTEVLWHREEGRGPLGRKLNATI